MSKRIATPSFLLLTVLASWIFGVVASVLLIDAGRPIFVFGVFATIVLGLFGRKLFRALHAQHAGTTLLLATLTMFGAYVHVANDRGANADWIGQEWLYEGTVYSQRFTESGSSIQVRNLSAEGILVEGKIRLSVPLYPKLMPGDRVRFSCIPEQPEPFNGFRYDRYLATQGIVAECFLHESPLVVAKDSAFVFTLFRWREEVTNRVEGVFGEPHAALVSGLFFGEKAFSDTWEGYFQRTGTSHIVAASGYNVSLVALVLFGLLTTFGVRRQRAFWLLVIGIVLYVIVAGMETPILRAGIMGTLVLLARFVGRKPYMGNALLGAVALMLFVEPRLFRDDVGFQLSVLSTVALIYFSPIIQPSFRFIPETLGLRESVSSTVSATLATLPIVLWSFGGVSLIGVLANLFVLPLIPYVMFLSAAAVLLAFFFPAFAVVIQAPAWLLLSLMLVMIRALSSVPFGYIEADGWLAIGLGLAGWGMMAVIWMWYQGNSLEKLALWRSFSSLPLVSK